MESAKSTATINDLKPFQGLSAASGALLSRGLRYAHYDKTTPVLKKGERVSGAYIVVTGQLRVFTVSPDGNEATLYLINSGETCVIALNCIFNDLLYPAWVESGPDTQVAVIPGSTYRILFESEPTIRNMTVQAFSTIVFRLMVELEEIHTYKLEQRLINFLLLRASMDGKIRMTQQEIASHLGTTREVIARILAQLVTEGHILTSRKQIVISDPSKLAGLLVHPASKPEKRLGKAPQPTSPLTRHSG